MNASTAYVPQDYWDSLLGAEEDERGVAYPHLSLALNRAMYAAELDQVGRLLDEEALPTPRRVLDIGSGTGIWVDFWKRRGARSVMGVDLTAAAVERLRARHPDATFMRADIGDPDLGLSGPFDAVSAMSVLLHVTDPERWRRALRTIGGLLAPGGYAVLIEPLVAHRNFGAPFGPGANSRVRTVAEYEAALADAGLTLASYRPATVLFANVADTRRARTFRALEWYWEAISMGLGPRERPGRFAASILEALDRPLRRRMPGGPTAKVMLVRPHG
jgi:SAM-dependent methyltransferase